MHLTSHASITHDETGHAAMLPNVFTHSSQDNWRLCGEGVFSWSVFRFYKARLLTQTGTFDPRSQFLLDLDYLRKLPGQQIVSTSIEEIARLTDVDAQRRDQWSASLLQIIPDVSLGDRLLGWFVPGVGVTFYSATQQLGQINDPEFVRAFSAIWLDERTRSPNLRKALLGSRQPEAQVALDSMPASKELRT